MAGVKIVRNWFLNRSFKKNKQFQPLLMQLVAWCYYYGHYFLPLYKREELAQTFAKHADNIVLNTYSTQHNKIDTDDIYASWVAERDLYVYNIAISERKRYRIPFIFATRYTQGLIAHAFIEHAPRPISRFSYYASVYVYDPTEADWGEVSSQWMDRRVLSFGRFLYWTLGYVYFLWRRFFIPAVKLLWGLLDLTVTILWLVSPFYIFGGWFRWFFIQKYIAPFPAGVIRSLFPISYIVIWLLGFFVYLITGLQPNPCVLHSRSKRAGLSSWSIIQSVEFSLVPLRLFLYKLTPKIDALFAKVFVPNVPFPALDNFHSRWTKLLVRGLRAAYGQTGFGALFSLVLFFVPHIAYNAKLVRLFFVPKVSRIFLSSFSLIKLLLNFLVGLRNFPLKTVKDFWRGVVGGLFIKACACMEQILWTVTQNGLYKARFRKFILLIVRFVAFTVFVLKACLYLVRCSLGAFILIYIIIFSLPYLWSFTALDVVTIATVGWPLVLTRLWRKHLFRVRRSLLLWWHWYLPYTLGPKVYDFIRTKISTAHQWRIGTYFFGRVDAYVNWSKRTVEALRQAPVAAILDNVRIFCSTHLTPQYFIVMIWSFFKAGYSTLISHSVFFRKVSAISYRLIFNLYRVLLMSLVGSLWIITDSVQFFLINPFKWLSTSLFTVLAFILKRTYRTLSYCRAVGRNSLFGKYVAALAIGHPFAVTAFDTLFNPVAGLIKVLFSGFTWPVNLLFQSGICCSTFFIHAVDKVLVEIKRSFRTLSLLWAGENDSHYVLIFLPRMLSRLGKNLGYAFYTLGRILFTCSINILKLPLNFIYYTFYLTYKSVYVSFIYIKKLCVFAWLLPFHIFIKICKVTHKLCLSSNLRFDLSMALLLLAAIFLLSAPEFITDLYYTLVPLNGVLSLLTWGGYQIFMVWALFILVISPLFVVSAILWLPFACATYSLQYIQTSSLFESIRSSRYILRSAILQIKKLSVSNPIDSNVFRRTALGRLVMDLQATTQSVLALGLLFITAIMFFSHIFILNSAGLVIWLVKSFILLVYCLSGLLGIYGTYFLFITPILHALKWVCYAILVVSSLVILAVASSAHIVICFGRSVWMAAYGFLTDFIYFTCLPQIHVPTTMQACLNLVRFVLLIFITSLHQTKPVWYICQAAQLVATFYKSKLSFWGLFVKTGPATWFDLHPTYSTYPRIALFVVWMEFLCTHLLWALQTVFRGCFAILATLNARPPRTAATVCRRMRFYITLCLKRVLMWPYRPNPTNLVALLCFYCYQAIDLVKWAWSTHLQPIPLGWHILSIHIHFISVVKYIAQVYIYVLGLYVDLLIDLISYIYASKARIYTTTVNFYYTNCERTGKVICRPFFRLVANHLWLAALLGMTLLGRFGWVVFIASRGIIAYHYWLLAVGFQVIFTIWTWFLTATATTIVAWRTAPKSGWALRAGFYALPETAASAYQLVQYRIARAFNTLTNTEQWRTLVAPLAAKRFSIDWLILHRVYKNKARSFIRFSVTLMHKGQHYWHSAWRPEALQILKALKNGSVEPLEGKSSNTTSRFQLACGLFFTYFVYTTSIHWNSESNTVMFGNIWARARLFTSKIILYPAETLLHTVRFVIAKLLGSQTRDKLTVPISERNKEDISWSPHYLTSIIFRTRRWTDRPAALLCYGLLQLSGIIFLVVALFAFVQYSFFFLLYLVAQDPGALSIAIHKVVGFFALFGLTVASCSVGGIYLILCVVKAFKLFSNGKWICIVTMRALIQTWKPLMLQVFRYLKRPLYAMFSGQFFKLAKHWAFASLGSIFSPKVRISQALQLCVSELEKVIFGLNNTLHKNYGHLNQHRTELINTLFNEVALRRQLSFVWYTFLRGPADYLRDFLTQRLTLIMDWLLPSKLRPKLEDIHIDSLWKGADKVPPGVQPKLVLSGFWYKDMWEQKLSKFTLFGGLWGICSRAVRCIYHVPLHYIWPAIVESIFWIIIELLIPLYFIQFFLWTFTWLFLNIFRRMSFMHKPKTQYWPMADIIKLRNEVKWHRFYITRNNSLMLDVPYPVRFVGPFFRRLYRQLCKYSKVETLVKITEPISKMIITWVRKPFIDPILNHIINKYIKTAFYIVAQTAIYVGAPFKHRKYTFYTYLTVVLTEMKLKYKMLKHTFRWVVFLYLLRRAWRKTIEFIMEVCELIIRSVPYLLASLMIDLIDWTHWFLFIAPGRLITAFTRGFLWNAAYTAIDHEISAKRPVWNPTGWRIALNVVLKFPRVLRQVLGLFLVGGFIPLGLRGCLELAHRLQAVIKQALKAQSFTVPVVREKHAQLKRKSLRNPHRIDSFIQRGLAKERTSLHTVSTAYPLHAKLLVLAARLGLLSLRPTAFYNSGSLHNISIPTPTVAAHIKAVCAWTLANYTHLLALLVFSFVSFVERSLPAPSYCFNKYLNYRANNAITKGLLWALFGLKKHVVNYIGMVGQLKLVSSLSEHEGLLLGRHRLRYRRLSMHFHNVNLKLQSCRAFITQSPTHFKTLFARIFADLYWRVTHLVEPMTAAQLYTYRFYLDSHRVLIFRQCAQLLVNTPDILWSSLCYSARLCKPVASTFGKLITYLYTEAFSFLHSPDVVLTLHWLCSFFKTPYHALLFLSLDLPGFLLKKLFFAIGIKELRYRGLLREIVDLADVSRTILNRYPELVLQFQQFVGGCIKGFFFYFMNHLWALLGRAWRELLGPISLTVELEAAITRSMSAWIYPRPEEYIPTKHWRPNVIAKLILYIVTAWDYIPLVIDYYTKQILKHYPEARDRLIRRHHDFVREFALIFSSENRKVWYFLHPTRPDEMKYAQDLFDSQIHTNRVKRKRIDRLVDFQFITVSLWDGRLKPTNELSLLPSMWRSNSFNFRGGRLNVHSSSFWSIWYFLEGILGYIWWFMLRPTIMVFTIIFDHLLNNYYNVARYIPRVLIILPFKVYFIAPIKAFATVYRQRVDKRLWPLVVGFCIALVLGWYGLLALDEISTRRWGRWYPIAAASALPVTSWTILIDPLFTIHALAYGLGMSIFYQTVIDPWKGSFWKVTVATIIIVWVAFLHPYHHDDLEVPNFVVFMAYWLLYFLRFDLEMRHGWGYLFCILFIGLTPLYVLQFTFHIPRHSYIREPDVREYYRRQTIRWITYTRPFYTYWFSFMVIYYNLVFYAYPPDALFMQLTPIEALRQFIAFFGLESELEFYNIDDLGMDFTEDWGQHMEHEDYYPYGTYPRFYGESEALSRRHQFPYVNADYSGTLLMPNPQSLVAVNIPFTDYRLNSLNYEPALFRQDYGNDWWRFMKEGPEWRQYFRPKVRKTLRRANFLKSSAEAFLYDDTLPRNVLHLFPSLHAHDYTIGEFSPVWEHWASDPREESSVTWWGTAHGGWEASAIEASAIVQQDVTYLWDGVGWNPDLDHFLLTNKIDRNFGAQFIFANWDTFKYFSSPYRMDYMLFWRWDTFEPWAWDWVSMGWKTINFIRKWFLPIDITRWLIENRYEIRNEIVLMYLLGKAEAHRYFLSLILHPVQYEILISSNRI